MKRKAGIALTLSAFVISGLFSYAYSLRRKK